MDTQRLILFVVFSFSLLMLWENWQKHEQPVAAVSAPTQATSAGVAPVPTLGQQAAPVSTPIASAPGLVNGPRAVVTTNVLRAEIDANGGDLRSLDLTRYQDAVDKKKTMRLLEQAPGHEYIAQSGLIGSDLPTHKTLFQLTPGNYTLAPGQDMVQVPMTWVDPATGVKVTKTYTFHRDSYEIEVGYQISNPSKVAIPVYAYFQLLRDDKAPEGESHFIHTYTGPALYTEQSKFKKIEFKQIDKGEHDYPRYSDDGWIGMVQHHFVSAWLPKNGPKREFYTKPAGGGLYSAGVIMPEGSVQPGANLSFTTPLYAGPQIQKTLTALAPGLDYVVDYGMLTPIAAPIFWTLQKIHHFVGNWGWSIVILTILIKLMFLPLSAKSYKSMALMRGLAPRLQRLKEQYGDDRQKLHQAMMELYKTEKINPLGGCLPVVVQIPVFISLYWTLLGSVEMRQAPFILWIHDLSAPDPYYVLPIIMGITMLVQTRLNPTPPDPIQAKVMMIMPVAFSIFFFFFPAGLVLYWLVNNLISISQQWYITRRVEAAKVGHAKP
ncbi:MAG: membrane protein insertase YidC [Pseudomonadota bacterium]